MRKFSKGRGSPSLVISIVALVLAAGGTSLASGSVALVAKTLGLNSKQSKQARAVADTEIAHKAGGLSVHFASSAGSAGHAGSATEAANAANAVHASVADAATSAGNAATVGGLTVQKVALSEPLPSSGSTTTTLFTLDGLTVTHACAAGGEQRLSAATTQMGILKLLTTNDSGLQPFGFEKVEFTPAEGTVNMYQGMPESENVGGRLVWQTMTGQVLTFIFQDETNAFGGENCVLGGTVTSG